MRALLDILPFYLFIFLLPKLDPLGRLGNSFLLLMSIFSLARDTSNLFLLITHNFQVVWPPLQLAPSSVFTDGCWNCLVSGFLFSSSAFSMNNQSGVKTTGCASCFPPWSCSRCVCLLLLVYLLCITAVTQGQGDPTASSSGAKLKSPLFCFFIGTLII